MNGLGGTKDGLLWPLHRFFLLLFFILIYLGGQGNRLS